MDKLNPTSISRDRLATFLKSPDLIRAFESLFNVTAQTPDAVDEVTRLVQTAQQDADSAGSAALLAGGVAQLALAIAREISDGPTPLHLSLTQQVDDLTGQLSSAAAQINALERRIASLEERPLP